MDNSVLRGVPDVAGRAIGGRAARLWQRRFAPSLRWYLIALTAAITLPAFSLASVEALDAIDARQSEATQHMRLLLANSVQGVRQGVAAMTATAQVLALSPALASADLVRFRLEAEEVAAARGVDVVLRDPAGLQRVATRVPRGAPLPSLPPEDRQARAAIERGNAFVSDAYTSGMTYPFLTRIVVPAASRGGTEQGYAVELALPPHIVSGWLDIAALPPGWAVSVVGRNGMVIAHTGDSGRYVGRGTPPDVFGAERGETGPWQGFDLDGAPLTGVYARVPAGWTVMVGATDQVLARPMQRTLMVLAGSAAPLLLAGLGLCVLLARRIDRSAAALERAARALGEGKIVAEAALPVRDLAFVQDAISRAGRDIADRRIRERTLLSNVRSGRDLLQAVVDGSEDLIFARDVDGRIVLANQASAALFGLPAGAAAAGRQLDVLLPPGVAAAMEAIAPGQAATVPIVDGRLFEVSHSVLRDPAGSPAGTVSIAREVTQRIAAEARLQRLQSDLARAGRLSAVAAMGAGLAHELHQPLSAAANFLAVAMRRLASLQPPQPQIAAALPPIADAMAEASAQVLRTGTIVQRLRGFIGAAEMQAVPLAPLVREAAEAAWQHAAPESERGGTHLHLDLDPALQALVDPVLIQQVVSNLVRNAADALPPDGGHIWVVLEPAPDGSASVGVLDSGHGIDPLQADRLFDVFSGSSKKDGMGVGLAICRTIISAHGGWITAANHDGGGAAFVFTLPPVMEAFGAAGARNAA